MNSQEYLSSLKQKLAPLSPEERDAALSYYEEYFAEAGEENFAEVAKGLGSPSALAAQILAESTIRQAQNNQLQAEGAAKSQDTPQPKRGLSAIKIIILGILALPMAIPLLCVLLSVIIAFASIIVALIVSLLAIVVAFAVAAVVIFVKAIPLFIFNAGLGLLLLGISLICAAFTIICAWLLWGAVKLSIRGLIGISSKMFSFGRRSVP